MKQSNDNSSKKKLLPPGWYGETHDHKQDCLVSSILFAAPHKI